MTRLANKVHLFRGRRSRNLPTKLRFFNLWTSTVLATGFILTWFTWSDVPIANFSNGGDRLHDYRNDAIFLNRSERQSGVLNDLTNDTSEIVTFYQVFAASLYFLEPLPCKPDIRTVILVKTTFSSLATTLRETGRDMWADPENKNPGVRHQTIFVVETTLTPVNLYQFKYLREEHDKYGDILFAYPYDLTNKLLANKLLGMAWTINRCQSAEFIVHVTDSMVGDVSQLHQKSIFTFAGKNEKILSGKLSQWTESPQLDRTFSKVNLSTRGGFPFCSPDVHALSIAAVHELLNWSLTHASFIHLYDVYLGMLGKTYEWRLIPDNLFE